MNFVFISPNFPESYYLFAERLKQNGIDVLVSGSTIFGAPDAAAMIADIRARAEAAFRA